jgi:predicted transcriptional regulator
MTKIAERSSDDSSHEKILRELAFARMIERGLRDSRSGRTISNEEMHRKVQSWQAEDGTNGH